MRQFSPFVLVILFLSIGSCQLDIGPKNQAEDPCEKNIRDYPVFSGTAKIWEKSWADVCTEVNLSSSTPDFQRFFDYPDMEVLRSQCESCNGIRAYFGLENPGSDFPVTPELILVNADNCNDVFGDSVLVSNGTGYPSWKTKAEATQMAVNWKNLIRQQQSDSVTYDSIYAYTFAKDRFIVPGEGGVLIRPTTFTFCLHSDNQVDEADPTQGALMIDLIMQNGVPMAPITGGEPTIDFAYPCPKYCDPGSAMYQLK